MEKIKLTSNSKRILKSLATNNYMEIPSSDYADINFLRQEKLIDTIDAETGDIIHVELTDKGKAYLHMNPKLKNPSIWEDKKYWITTFLALVAIGISIIALDK